MHIAQLGWKFCMLTCLQHILCQFWIITIGIYNLFLAHLACNPLHFPSTLPSPVKTRPISMLVFGISHFCVQFQITNFISWSGLSLRWGRSDVFRVLRLDLEISGGERRISLFAANKDIQEPSTSMEQNLDWKLQYLTFVKTIDTELIKNTAPRAPYLPNWKERG